MLCMLYIVAVKCNDDPAILAVLAQCGTGFDCASKVVTLNSCYNV
jgi:diaminopimelate decarboxylase